MVVFSFDWQVIVTFASNMQPPEKSNTKWSLFVRMLLFEKEPVILISLSGYMPLENRKRKKYNSVLGTFQPNFEQVYTSWEQNKEKWKLRRLLAEHKTSIFNPKFG